MTKQFITALMFVLVCTSARANFEKGEVGRFGYKSQAASLESFNRGAIFNQMGITSDPLFYEFLELQDSGRQDKGQHKVINQNNDQLLFDNWNGWINLTLTTDFFCPHEFLAT